MLSVRLRNTTVALCCGALATLATCCASPPTISFAIRNACETPISVGLRADTNLESSVDTVTAEVGQTRVYRLRDDPPIAAVSVIVVPTNGGLTPPVNTRAVELGDIKEGAGTRGDPYAIVVDGDLCRGD